MSPTKVNHVHRRVGLYGSGIKYVHCACGTCGLPFVLIFIKMLIKHISHVICNTYVRTLCKQVLQLHKPCAEWHIAMLPHSTFFSGFLRSVAFLPQAFRSQSVDFRRSSRALSPTLLYVGAMHSGQLFSIRIVRRFTPGALQMVDNTLLVYKISV